MGLQPVCRSSIRRVHYSHGTEAIASFENPASRRIGIGDPDRNHIPNTMTPASTIAHYKITAKLGEGGMGAVYHAKDTKLNRDVAIKVLPEPFAADPDRLARFTREAQLLASL